MENICKSPSGKARNGGLFWSALYGKHLYSFFVSAEGGAASEAKEFFESELMDNELLLEDFPEVCYPFRKTEGIKQRKLTYHGKPVNLAMTGNKVLLPTMRVYGKDGNLIKNEKGKPVHYSSSGALIRFISVASTGVRGRQHPIADRGNVRPSLALIDDPANDGSAKSENEIGKLEDFVRKTIIPASGYTRETKRINPMRILITATCIQPNDFAVRFADRRLNPDFNGLLFRRFPKMPNPIPKLWWQYKELWVEDGGSRSKPCLERKATQFYLANKKAMDSEFEVDDIDDYEPFQVSAIQYGMDMWCENEKAFWCEHQNDPEAALAAVMRGLTPRFITREKVKRFSDDRKRLSFRRWVPENTEFLAGFIDVGLHYLNYEVVAFGKGFSFAHVVDFGYFPDQKGWHEIRKHNYNVDIQESYRNGSPEEKISWAVRDCLTEMFSRDYYDHNGEPLDIHRLLDLSFGRDEQRGRFLAMVGVDARDFDQEEAVWSGIAQFNAQSRDEFPALNRALPCYGEPTKTRHLRHFDLRPGEWQRGRDRFRAGEGEWIEHPIFKFTLAEKYAGLVHSCLMWEANAYRTLRNTAWMTEVGANGCQTLFDDLPEIILPYAKQQCAMVAGTKSLPGSEYDEWVLPKPNMYDKEFFDTNSGCWMIASYVGLNPEFGITIEIPEADYRKGVHWLEKIKTKTESEVPQVRGRTRR